MSFVCLRAVILKFLKNKLDKLTHIWTLLFVKTVPLTVVCLFSIHIVNTVIPQCNKEKDKECAVVLIIDRV